MDRVLNPKRILINSASLQSVTGNMFSAAGSSGKPTVPITKTQLYKAVCLPNIDACTSIAIQASVGCLWYTAASSSNKGSRSNNCANRSELFPLLLVIRQWPVTCVPLQTTTFTSLVTPVTSTAPPPTARGSWWWWHETALHASTAVTAASAWTVSVRWVQLLLVLLPLKQFHSTFSFQHHWKHHTEFVCPTNPQAASCCSTISAFWLAIKSKWGKKLQNIHPCIQKVTQWVQKWKEDHKL